MWTTGLRHCRSTIYAQSKEDRFVSAQPARTTVLASLTWEILCFPTGFPRAELREIFPLGEHAHNAEVFERSAE